MADQIESSILQQAHDRAEKLRREEQQIFEEEGKPWGKTGTYGSTFDQYDGTFREVLHGVPLREVVRRLSQEKGRKISVLDVMADTNGIASVASDIVGGVAITRSEFRDDIQRTRDDTSNIVLVDGDVTKPDPWNRAHIWLKENGLDSFDLVVARPRCGWRGVSPGVESPIENLKAYYIVFSRMYNATSFDKGLMLVELPDEVVRFTSKAVEGMELYKPVVPTRLTWDQDILQHTKGLEVELKDGALKIVKSTDAPIRLPYPSTLNY